MQLDSTLFYLFAAQILVSALMTITRRNVVYSAVWLISTLVGVAGIYLLRGAEFLAGVQVIVYIGGIMVLFLFVIMLVPISEESKESRFASQKWVVLIVTALLSGELAYFLSKGVGEFAMGEPTVPAEMGVVTTNSEQVGQVLFSEYLLPFELASILLLVAMIGAIVMAKVRPGAE